MGSSAAASLLLILLFCAAGLSSSGWRVTYYPQSICAIKGSTVKMHCFYNHPKKKGSTTISVTETFWFTKIDNGPVDVTTQEEYAGRVEHSCEQKSCTLTIQDLKESDSAVYRFRFITNTAGGRYTGEQGVRLSVTDPVLKVEKTYRRAQLKCSSSCFLPDHFKYVWYRNGNKVNTRTPVYDDVVNYSDSMSCAVEGYEEFPSPSFCDWTNYCNKVIYRDRRICAFKGSSVTIHSDYNPDSRSVFWFNPGRSKEWKNQSQPENLEQDSQYAGRVHVNNKIQQSTLEISNLTETDSAEYRFMLETKHFKWGIDLHGTTLTVTALQVQVTKTSPHQDSTYVELKCHSSCTPAGRIYYIWYKNGQRFLYYTSTYKGNIGTSDKISCAAVFLHEEHRAPEVYAPVSPSASAHPSGDIVEGSTVFLNCSSEANPPANYTWYKKNKTATFKLLVEVPRFPLNTIQLSDSGLYYCIAKNQLGNSPSRDLEINVKYAPKRANVSLSRVEMVEGSSVNLTCSSDGNPTPSYTWYKDNRMMLQGQGGVYQFASVRSEDSGIYRCQAQNTYGLINSSSAYLNVEYSPRSPSVSVNPPGEIPAGRSVNLTCSSVANPAATYVWFKENSTTPAAVGHIFTIVDIKPEHGGHFYCHARNRRGHHNSTFHLIVVSSSAASAVAGSITFILLAGLFVFAFIVFRKKMAARQISETRARPGDNGTKRLGNLGQQLETLSTAALGNSTDQDDVYYASVLFSKKQQDDPLYSNFVPAKPKTPQNEEEEDVEYSMVMDKPGLRSQDASEESSVLYSTVNKVNRL